MASSSPQFVLKNTHDDTVSDTSAFVDEVMGAAYGSYDSSGGISMTPDTHEVDECVIDEDILNKVNNPDNMREWLVQNYYKFEGYDNVKICLLEILREYIPGFDFSSAGDHSLESMINSLDFYLQELHRKILRIDVELGELSGSEMAARIENHKQRVMDTIDDFNDRLRKANEENLQLKIVNADLHRQLTDCRKEVDSLKGQKHGSDDAKVTYDPQSSPEVDDRNWSSLLEEFQRERLKHDQMQQQAATNAKLLVQHEEETMLEIARLSQNVEISSDAENMIYQMLENKSSLSETPNMEDCERVIRDWLTELKGAMHENRKEIKEATDDMKSAREADLNLQEQIAKLESFQTDREVSELDTFSLLEIKGSPEEREKIFDRLRDIQEKKYDLIERMKELNVERDARLMVMQELMRDKRLEIQSPYDSTLSSGGYPHGRSPATYSQGYPTDTSTESSSTPFQRNIQAPGTDSDSSGWSPVVGRMSPGTQSFPAGAGRLTPGTQSPRNYQQNTSIERTRPRMADSPMRVEHRAQTTPRAFKTPLVSTARFAYTDPTARFINRDDFVFDAGQSAHPVGAMSESPEMAPTTPKGTYKYAMGRRLFAED